MADRYMKQVIRSNQLGPYIEEYFWEKFGIRTIEHRLDFLLPRFLNLSHLLDIAEQLNLIISLKKKQVSFILTENDHTIAIKK